MKPKFKRFQRVMVKYRLHNSSECIEQAPKLINGVYWYQIMGRGEPVPESYLTSIEEIE